jgi:hypothetical protein
MTNDSSIVQDDVDDWRRESSKMVSIYESSYLNIAATWASDGSQGCLPLVGHRVAGASTIPGPTLTASASSIDSIADSTWEATKFSFESVLWTGEVERAPLLLRRWVLQELILAPL